MKKVIVDNTNGYFFTKKELGRFIKDVLKKVAIEARLEVEIGSGGFNTKAIIINCSKTPEELYKIKVKNSSIVNFDLENYIKTLS